jgi:hypothetical protein
MPKFLLCPTNLQISSSSYAGQLASFSSFPLLDLIDEERRIPIQLNIKELQCIPPLSILSISNLEHKEPRHKNRYRISLHIITNHRLGIHCVQTLPRCRFVNHQEAHTRECKFVEWRKEFEHPCLDVFGASVGDVLGVEEYGGWSVVFSVWVLELEATGYFCEVFVDETESSVLFGVGLEVTSVFED